MAEMYWVSLLLPCVLWSFRKCGSGGKRSSSHSGQGQHYIQPCLLGALSTWDLKVPRSKIPVLTYPPSEYNSVHYLLSGLGLPEIKQAWLQSVAVSHLFADILVLQLSSSTTSCRLPWRDFSRIFVHTTLFFSSFYGKGRAPFFRIKSVPVFLQSFDYNNAFLVFSLCLLPTNQVSLHFKF